MIHFWTEIVSLNGNVFVSPAGPILSWMRKRILIRKSILVRKTILTQIDQNEPKMIKNDPEWSISERKSFFWTEMLLWVRPGRFWVECEKNILNQKKHFESKKQLLNQKLFFCESGEIFWMIEKTLFPNSLYKRNAFLIILEALLRFSAFWAQKQIFASRSGKSPKTAKSALFRFFAKTAPKMTKKALATARSRAHAGFLRFGAKKTQNAFWSENVRNSA